ATNCLSCHFTDSQKSAKIDGRLKQMQDERRMKI
ncbi:hypothetical protein OPU39_03615, partial [Acinetobacter nosocomialis]|nr:hypothetical protein [Acinetobacter nosocomialis]